MVYFQQLALAAAVSSAVVLTGCSGSSSGSANGGDTDGGGAIETTSVSGTAEAPSGAIASLEPVSPLQFAINFLVSPVAAAITGLDPVGGATVELIRVNNAGDDFSFADGGSGVVDIAVTDLAEGEATLNGSDFGNAFLNYFTEIGSGETETITASYLNGGIVTFEYPFEESIEGDVGFRYPPGILQFQKVAGNNVMFLIASDPLVRYRAVDTNGDNEKDAVDPDQKDGDEILYSLETFVKKPTAATAEGLAGDFGRVYLGTYLEKAHWTSVQRTFKA